MRFEGISTITCVPNNAAARRYTRRFLLTMCAYGAALVFDVWYFTRFHPAGAGAYILAVLPALPIVGVIVVVGLYLADEQDEFQRTILVQSMLWAIGATLAVTTVWGFLENFTGVRHLQPYLIFPLFWFFVGVATPLLKAKYR
jgi:hypothetical protein